VTTCNTCDKADLYKQGRCVGERDERKPQCPVFGIPSWVWGVITLYNRCRANQCMPYDGGIMDQPERLMRFFDVIDNAMESQRKSKGWNNPRPKVDQPKPPGKR
jgi:hypothetical protein